MNLFDFFKHLNKVWEELSVKDVSKDFPSLEFNRERKQIVGSTSDIERFQKTVDSKLFEEYRWTYNKTDKQLELPEEVVSEFVGVTFKPMTKEIVVSEKILRVYSKTKEYRDLIQNGWVTTITKQNGDNKMVEFLEDKKLVVLPESIAKYLDNRVYGQTNVAALLELQSEIDKETKPTLSNTSEICDYCTIPYKYRMKILVKFQQGFGYTSHERQTLQVLHDVPDMNELVENTRKWAYDRGLIESDPAKQMLKVIEELGEVGAAMARGNVDEIIDGIGDVTVTLIILASQHELDFEHCLEVAYNEIKDRKGELRDGSFIKEEDLNNA